MNNNSKTGINQLICFLLKLNSLLLCDVIRLVVYAMTQPVLKIRRKFMKKKKTHFGSKGQTDIIEDIFNNNRRAHTGHPIKSVMFKMLFADAAIQIS